MIKILLAKIRPPFLFQFLPASLLGASAAARAENCGRYILEMIRIQMRNTIDQKLVAVAWGRFIRYRIVTVTGNRIADVSVSKSVCIFCFW
jgi:hypothetical protein